MIAAVGSPQKFRSGGVVTMLELDPSFGLRDIVGIRNQQSGAVSYASPRCDASPKQTDNNERRLPRPFSIV